MPTVVREGGFEIKINVNDHFPAHVHVWKAGARFEVDLTTGVASEVKGTITRDDIRKGRRIVAWHAAELKREWVRIHGSLERIN
jgi:hypothetical protein